MSITIDRIRCTKGTVIIGELDPKEKDGSIFSKEKPIGLSYLKK